MTRMQGAHESTVEDHAHMRRRSPATLSQSGWADPPHVHTSQPSNDGKAEENGESKMTKFDLSKPVRGRPCAVIAWTVVDRLCACMCTKREIAGVIAVSEDTLDRAIKRTFGSNFAAYFEQKSAAARVSLRHRQYEAAMAGNIGMLIWLGKQWLGQTEKVEQVNVSDPLAELVIEFRKRSDILERTASSEDPIPGEAPPSTHQLNSEGVQI